MIRNPTNHLYTRYLKGNRLLILLLLILGNAAALFLSDRLFMTRGLYEKTWLVRLAPERIDSLFEESRRWFFYSLLLVPVWLLIRILFSGFCLYIGLVFKEIRASFHDTFNIALKAEIVFLLAALLKIGVLVLRRPISSMEELNYYPLSLISVTGTHNLYTWLVYALQSLNLFEILYGYLLAKGLELTMKKEFQSMFGVVGLSYGIGFLVWIAMVTLFMLSLSQP